jgi:hypothetical protein
MNFNFYERYKDYSTFELKKILQQTGDYQPAAVEAVTAILKERELLPESANGEGPENEAIAGTDEETRTAGPQPWTGKIALLLKPVLQPVDNIQPNRWLNILLILLALRFIWLVYGAFKLISLGTDCEDCAFDKYFWLAMLNAPFIGLVLFLMLKQRTLGWILLCSECVFLITSGLTPIYYYLMKADLLEAGLGELLFFLPVICRIAVVIYLCRPDVSGIFGITQQRKKKVITITVGLTLLYMLEQEILYG